MVDVVIVVLGWAEVGVGIVEDSDCNEVGASCDKLPLFATSAVLLSFEDFEESAPPTPPPTAAATTMRRAITTIQNTRLRSPHIVLGECCL